MVINQSGDFFLASERTWTSDIMEMIPRLDSNEKYVELNIKMNKVINTYCT